jgi:hypothetical protein
MSRLALGRVAQSVRTTRLALSLPLALGLSGCERPSDVTPPPAPVEASPSRRLATPTAFDLAPAPGGAVLAWAAAGSDRLQWTRFDADSHPLSGEGALVPIGGAGAAVADLALAAIGSDVALAWSEASADQATLRAAWSSSDGAARSFDLGASFPGAGASRGGLALVGRERGALLLARGREAPCSDARERACSAFHFFEIAPDAARPTGLSLTVPNPCAAHSAQLVSAQPASARGAASGEAGPFEYAICAGGAGASALTVFSIQPSPAYAAAEEALAGCTPLGAGRFGGEATFVGACGAQRRSVSVPADGGALVVRNLDERGLICNASGPLLRFGNGWLRPREPLGRLELLLDDDLAPAGARAVWTGAALLVAQASDGQLSLRRYGCRHTQLLELDFQPSAPSGAEMRRPP